MTLSKTRIDCKRARTFRESRTDLHRVRSDFLTFQLLIIGHDRPGGNQRADDVAIAPSNPVGVLFTDTGCARLSRGAEKPKETSSKPVSSWNWFRTRRKPPAVVHVCSPVGSLVKRTAARPRRSSCTSFERIPNRDRTRSVSEVRWKTLRIDMSHRRTRTGLRKPRVESVSLQMETCRRVN